MSIEVENFVKRETTFRNWVVLLEKLHNQGNSVISEEQTLMLMILSVSPDKNKESLDRERIKAIFSLMESYLSILKDSDLYRMKENVDKLKDWVGNERPDNQLNNIVSSFVSSWDVGRVVDTYLSCISRFLVSRSETFLSITEVSENTGYGIDHLRELARDGLVTACNVDRVWFISMKSLDEYQRSKETSFGGPRKPYRKDR